MTFDKEKAPVILIPVAPQTVLEKIGPLFERVQKSQQQWIKAAEQIHKRRLAESQNGWPFASELHQVMNFCATVRRLHALASLACAPFNLVEGDALMVAEAECDPLPAIFDFYVEQELKAD